MSATTSIQWTDRTWNPVRGCSIVSPGCTNCYAMKQAHRFSGPGGAYEGLTQMSKGGPIWNGKIRFVHESLDDPMRWKKPCRVFVNSMSDVFHELVLDSFVHKMFYVMRKCPQHTFQILTKRPERMREFMTRSSILKPLPNVWLGVSVENQRTADERIPILLDTPSAVRWISAEPLLEEINLTVRCPPHHAAHLRSDRINWVVIGGEAGPGARPFDLAWARLLIRQCREADIPVFMKQLGSHARVRLDPGSDPKIILRLRDRKGGNMAEWPTDLQIREYPGDKWNDTERRIIAGGYEHERLRQDLADAAEEDGYDGP